LFQQAVDDIVIENGRAVAVITQSGLRFDARAIVLTAGTFLAGKIHVGLTNHAGGRAGDPPASRLAERLREGPFRVDRLKTGTPPRIDGRSLDYSVFEEQAGDQPIPSFSYLASGHEHPTQVSCWITHTNERTHDIIRGGLDRSPMYSGVIEGIGPRYCPSIEDKIVRFADKSSHQIFIEPEGLETHEIYPNGISTSLPFDVQLALVHSIRGFENAHITRPGYAIEYDYFDPRGLGASLETKAVAGLFFAGQINGTTGYEEAGAQGLVAGLNAARAAAGSGAVEFARDEAYIGVMIDDLVTRGVTEPYRMFTSRAEFRLTLRADNADQRLTERGIDAGVVGSDRAKVFHVKQRQLAEARAFASSHSLTPSGAQKLGLTVKADGQRRDIGQLLAYPDVTLDRLTAVWPQIGDWTPAVREQVEIDAAYSGYLDRQQADVDAFRRDENLRLPADLDYGAIGGLSNEVREKLQRVRPLTLGQAARIEGVTPGAITALLAHVRRARAA
jgi:tRNA uridine 5-carboxymethylaminomethyl modification enzyme